MSEKLNDPLLESLRVPERTWVGLTQKEYDAVLSKCKGLPRARVMFEVAEKLKEKNTCFYRI